MLLVLGELQDPGSPGDLRHLLDDAVASGHDLPMWERGEGQHCLPSDDFAFAFEDFEDHLFFQKRCQVEGEVKYLRDAISQLKVSISTITKGVSMSKIEVNIVQHVH